ncbi:lasso peptide biosynthesis B2 protein [Paenibacillus oryzisoli]|uniref:Stage V sporulation protein S n=1 Tax=Paenibacillus oryzisoli TaxID=1850517 RepID=A0A198A7U6_9BACL|nr:lasso peptide biosynthesis B2 protein [Paenibacillus oryzisoli]OAS17217.1 stage V sporulation protein S [Paenibacillus oryzisoli]
MVKITFMRKFFSLNRKTMFLFVEAFIYLAWARILISVPFAKIAPSLGKSMEESVQDQPNIRKVDLIQIHDAIGIISRHTVWESKCLVRAIAAMKMLKRREISSTLYMGTRKDETGKMIAHAWLRSGPFFITGAEGKDGYVVVGKFANHCNR